MAQIWVLKGGVMARKIQQLTNTQVEKAKYNPQGKNELNDGYGLFLHIYPTNAKKWRFRYAHPTTKARTKITLGEYPLMTLAQARSTRDEYRRLLSDDIDPKAHKTQQERNRALESNNRFISIALQWKAKKQGEITLKTLEKYWRSLELHVFPFIAELPVTEITPAIALEPLKRVEARNNIDMAQRLASYINEILNFAVNGGAIAFNPCLKMAKNLKRIQKINNPHVSPEELPKLLADIEKASIEPQTRALIRFQMLTMVRPIEASQAEWAEIDLNQKLWTIPAEKMKAREVHKIPLSDQAVQILQRLQPITGRFKYVFTKRGNYHASASSSTVNTALKRMGYAGKQTAHGLRGLARTCLAEQGVNHEHAEACLAHKIGSNVSKAYNHATYLTQRRSIMQDWANFLERSLKM